MLTEMWGEKVRLRPLQEADLATRAKWTADEELALMMGVDISKEPFISPEAELKENREWLAERQEAGATVYAIEVGGRYIGDIDVTLVAGERRAQLTLFIGDRSEWSKGYGTETVQLVLDALFSDEPVDAVAVDVSGVNDRAYRFWEKLGFREYLTDDEGTRYMRLTGRDRVFR
jgi:RimJ/RimL family protein N-acetyltransferase